MNNKIIFIGPENIHQAFAAMDQYDFQQPITSLEELTEEMRSSTPTKISKESSVIMLFSRLYNENPDEFAKLSAFYAQHALVSILIPSQDKEMIPRIEGHIRTKQREFSANPNMQYNASAPIYFISYEQPIPELNQAMAEFVQDPAVHESAKLKVSDMLPEYYKNSMQMDDKLEEMDQELAEIFGDSDEVHIPEADDNASGKVIAVTSSKGGSGKSTVSMLLATYLAQGSKLSVEQGLESKPLKVCVVDLDTRDGQLGFLNGRTSPTVFNIYGESMGSMGKDIPESSVRKGIYSSPNIGADFIFAPRRTRHAKEINPSFYAALIQKLRSMYDYIILDTSVNYLDELLEQVAYPISDKIILVTDMGISSIMGMARWITETTSPKEKNGAGIDINKIAITVNKVMDGVNMGFERIQKTAMGIPIIAMLPSSPKLITYKANTGALDEVLLRKPINNSFKHLAQTIIGDEYQLAQLPYTEE